ncbi:MAG: magnesium/cobalt transporter CorA [Candidatus Azobacteroides sp.]|nr:magnesium/cobalt transporter CorA [Candidatus Azobacteroides sp.]
MSGQLKKKKEEIGISPYELVFRGQRTTDKIHIRVIDFNIDEVFEPEINSIQELEKFKSSPNISWINIDGLNHVLELKELANLFNIPDNIMSDILNPSVRPQVEEFESGLFISMKMLKYKPGTKKVPVENISLIILENTLLSFKEVPGDMFEPICERIYKHRKIIGSSGADYLAFTLMDVIIDNYIYLMELLGDKIEKLDAEMTKKELRKIFLKNINTYKMELNHLRRNIKPGREMIISLYKMETDLIQEKNEIHFKELLDNIKEAIELSDSYREELFDLLNIYHVTMSTKLNDVIKVLTIFSVIFIPLTFIVGVYGTNFDYLPELHWKYGYYGMWGIMILIVVSMITYFKHKKWF